MKDFQTNSTFIVEPETTYTDLMEGVINQLQSMRTTPEMDREDAFTNNGLDKAIEVIKQSISSQP